MKTAHILSAAVAVTMLAGSAAHAAVISNFEGDTVGMMPSNPPFDGRTLAGNSRVRDQTTSALLGTPNKFFQFSGGGQALLSNQPSVTGAVTTFSFDYVDVSGTTGQSSLGFGYAGASMDLNDGATGGTSFRVSLFGNGQVVNTNGGAVFGTYAEDTAYTVFAAVNNSGAAVSPTNYAAPDGTLGNNEADIFLKLAGSTATPMFLGTATLSSVTPRPPRLPRLQRRWRHQLLHRQHQPRDRRGRRADRGSRADQPRPARPRRRRPAASPPLSCGGLPLPLTLLHAPGPQRPGAAFCKNGGALAGPSLARRAGVAMMRGPPMTIPTDQPDVTPDAPAAEVRPSLDADAGPSRRLLGLDAAGRVRADRRPVAGRGAGDERDGRRAVPPDARAWRTGPTTARG